MGALHSHADQHHGHGERGAWLKKIIFVQEYCLVILKQKRWSVDLGILYILFIPLGSAFAMDRGILYIYLLLGSASVLMDLRILYIVLFLDLPLYL